jgi:UDP-glucose 4-epimerase
MILISNIIEELFVKKTILVPGGAGYIGSHTAYLLAQKNYHVIILDNFTHNQTVDLSWATVIKNDFGDEKILNKIFTNYQIDAVMHFAAFIEVGESVKQPQRFYQNNVIKTITLLNHMLKHNVKKVIFSSSCAVYGEPKKIPMDETNPYNPISPYGKNKLAIEFALQDYAKAYDLKYVSLRYFNAAGALPNMGLGEQHDPETHIIPLIIRALKNRKPFKIFGEDYDTPDGSCIRDYIHVLDIANAHLLALDYLEKTGKSDAFNLGSGTGFSVKEMITNIENMSGQKMITQKHDRRPGDPAILLADPSKAKKLLGWKPTNSDIKTILSSALEWEHPGFALRATPGKPNTTTVEKILS